MRNKGNRRFEWMTQFEKELLRLKPSLAGKIDWNTAAYFYNINLDPIVAARKAGENMTPVDLR